MRFVVEVDDDFHYRIVVRAAQQNVTVSKVIITLLDAWLSNKIKVNIPEKRQHKPRSK